MIYEEGEGYVLGPSPIPVHGVIFVLVVATCGFFLGLGYCTGHTAATAAIHKESS